jgi:CDP-glucose 4,6-dehydratase
MHQFWSARRVLVTGATGFLGAWLVRELRHRGAFVVGLMRDRPAEPLLSDDALAQPDFSVFGQLEDYDCLLRALDKYEVETVFHLAAQPLVGIAFNEPRATFEANIRGTWNLLEACRKITTVKRIVVASSDKAYGTAPHLPYNEEMPLAGRHPYDVSKSCADLIAQAYHATYALPVCVTRSANFYGGGDLNFSRIVPGTIRSVLRNEKPVLRSDGTLIRDYIFIRDVGGYLTLAEAMDRPDIHGRAYNFSIEAPLSVLDITNRILALMQRTDLPPAILKNAQGEIAAQHLSAARARRELGWSPQYGLDQGLTETIAWYKSYFVRHSGERRNQLVVPE